MGGTVRELKERLTLQEFRQWACYFEIKNEDYSQTDVNIARIAVGLHKFMGGGDLKIKDVLPTSKNVKKDQTKKQFQSNYALMRNFARRG